jgi:hypothetical protein
MPVEHGLPSADFLARFAGHAQVNSQPAGIDFLNLDWRNPMLRYPWSTCSVCKLSGVPPMAIDKGSRGLPFVPV